MLVLLCKEAFLMVCLVHWEQMLCKPRDGQWLTITTTMSMNMNACMPGSVFLCRSPCLWKYTAVRKRQMDHGCLHDWVCFPVHITMSVETQCSETETLSFRVSGRQSLFLHEQSSAAEL